MDVFAGAVVLHTLLDSRPSLLVLTMAEEGNSKGGELAVGQQYQVSSACPVWPPGGRQQPGATAALHRPQRYTLVNTTT